VPISTLSGSRGTPPAPPGWRRRTTRPPGSSPPTLSWRRPPPAWRQVYRRRLPACRPPASPPAWRQGEEAAPPKAETAPGAAQGLAQEASWEAPEEQLEGWEGTPGQAFDTRGRASRQRRPPPGGLPPPGLALAGRRCTGGGEGESEEPGSGARGAGHGQLGQPGCAGPVRDERQLRGQPGGAR